MKLTDEEWGAARKLRDFFGERLIDAAANPQNVGMGFLQEIPKTIESLERLLEAGHRRYGPMSCQVGDIVRLKSGSPPLTVSRLRGVHKDHDVIEVEWFKDGVLMRDAFDARCLVPQPPPVTWPYHAGEIVWINPNGDWAA